MTDNTDEPEELTSKQYMWLATILFAAAIGMREAFGIDTGLEYTWIIERGRPGTVMFLLIIGGLAASFYSIVKYIEESELETES